MKLGLIIKRGKEKEVTTEFNQLLEKSKEGYKDLVSITDNNTFKIGTEGLKVTFALDKCFNDEYAIYQMLD